MNSSDNFDLAETIIDFKKSIFSLKSKIRNFNQSLINIKNALAWTGIDQDKLNLNEKLKFDLENFTKTKKEILSSNNIYNEENIDPDLGEYARYILKEGTITDKRNLITGLNLEIYLHNRDFVLEKF